MLVSALKRAEIKRIQQELGITTILVTHDQVEAVTMADQVAVMRNGVIQQYSSPEDLLLKPANMFVASFMGDPPMNLMEAELSSENGKSVFRCGSELKIPVPDAIAQPCSRGGIGSSSWVCGRRTSNS